MTRVRSITARPVLAPLARPLATSGGTLSEAPLVLIDLGTEAGVTGHAYLFAYTPRALGPLARLVDELGTLVVGAPLAPLAIEETLRGSLRLLGTQGLAAMALAGIDTAAWDADAKLAGRPLVRHLGGAARPIPAYNSNGLGLIGPKAVGREAEDLLEAGFSALKLRLGYATLAEDVAAARALRAAVGESVTVMTDYNQALSVGEAIRRVRQLAEFDFEWVEEPTRWDDYRGHAEIRAKSPVPIQLGENCWGAGDLDKAIRAGACDCFMADAVRIGGVTGWLRAAALAETAGLPLSSHLFPEVSAHLLAVSPSRHWLEYVDWASPILAEPLAVEDGTLTAPERPGIGLAWDEAAVARYAVA